MGMNPLEVRRRVLMDQPHKETQTADIVSFKTTVPQALPVDISIEPVQSGTGDPSPANVRPITGRTGAKITRTGKNLFGGNALRDGVLNAITSTDYPDERYVQFGSGYTPHKAFSDGVKFKENTQYTFIMTIYKTSGTGANMRVYYTNGSYDNFPLVSEATKKETVVLVSDEGKSVRSLEKMTNSGSTRLYYDESGIFEGVLTADDFVAYQGNTFPIDWETEAGEVYGGTLNVKDGTLTSEWVSLPINAPNVAYNNSGISSLDESYTWASYRIAKAKAVEWYANTSGEDGNGFFNIGKWSSVGERGIGRAYTTSSYLVFVLSSNKYNLTTSAGRSDYLASLSETPRVWYRIKTPQVYQLIPTQVQALKGTNNLWNDISQTKTSYWTRKG